MEVTVTISLDMRRPKRDGTYPLVLRIRKDNSLAAIPLKIFLKQTDWDTNKRVIKSNFKGTESAVRLNNYLIKKKAELIDFITDLDTKKQLKSLSSTDIKNKFEKKLIQFSFFTYTELLIKNMLKANQVGNARIYKSIMVILKNYMQGKDLKFEQITVSFLNKLTTSHFEKGNSHNGLAVYMRTIRAIYNKAIQEGIIDSSYYPFKDYTIVTKKTAKRALPSSSIQKIEELELDENDLLFHTRNFFLASYYMRGIPYIDMALLKLSNIINGRIEYSRQKTDKPYSIYITDELNSIIRYYCIGKKKDDYIFPIALHEEIGAQYRSIENSRKRYNKKLKLLAERCGIEEKLTSYVSRHSFATQAKNMGIPITAISEMLGHESIKTTQIYLDSLPSDLLDEYHKSVFKRKDSK